MAQDSKFYSTSAASDLSPEFFFNVTVCHSRLIPGKYVNLYRGSFYSFLHSFIPPLLLSLSDLIILIVAVECYCCT
jgi:hypothetical protein